MGGMEAALGTLGIAIVGLLAEMVRRQTVLIKEANANASEARGHAAMAEEQTTNSHKTNLRDDMDEIRDLALELKGMVAILGVRMDGAAQVAGIQAAQVEALTERVDEHIVVANKYLTTNRI
jgi:hypothetical protein